VVYSREIVFAERAKRFKIIINDSICFFMVYSPLKLYVIIILLFTKEAVSI